MKPWLQLLPSRQRVIQCQPKQRKSTGHLAFLLTLFFWLWAEFFNEIGSKLQWNSFKITMWWLQTTKISFIDIFERNEFSCKQVLSNSFHLTSLLTFYFVTDFLLRYRFFTSLPIFYFVTGFLIRYWFFNLLTKGCSNKRWA